MGLFTKKLTLDEILKALPALSPEEKKQLHEKTSDLYKAEDEREIDKIEEEKAETPEKADEKADKVNEESEVIGKDVDELEGKAKEIEEKDEGESEEPEEAEETEEPIALDLKEEANEEVTAEEPSQDDENAETIKALTDRLNAIEETVSALNSLKEEMEAYVQKQKDAFGYKGNSKLESDDLLKMNSAELKNHILNN